MDGRQANAPDTTPIPLHAYRYREPLGCRLTPQEAQLLRLLIEGHHKKGAARIMGISINTVSFHLKNVYAKLKVHSKTEAVVKALHEGLVGSIECVKCGAGRVRSHQVTSVETAWYEQNARGQLI
jgi:DNA-binding CsgD family transcriptional regulator